MRIILKWVPEVEEFVSIVRLCIEIGFQKIKIIPPQDDVTWSNDEVFRRLFVAVFPIFWKMLRVSSAFWKRCKSNSRHQELVGPVRAHLHSNFRLIASEKGKKFSDVHNLFTQSYTSYFLRMSVDRPANVVYEWGSPLDRCSIQWKIHDFSFCLSQYLSVYRDPLFYPSNGLPPARRLRSPQYSTYWGLVLELQITKNLPYNDSSLTVSSIFCSSKGAHVRTEVSLIIDGQKYEPQKKTIYELETGSETSLWRMSINALTELTKGKLKEDELCINVDIEAWSEETTIVSKSSCVKTVESLFINNEITNLWIDKIFTDVTLECQGKKFEAHKLILAAASPVFKAMFKKGTKEHRDNYVNIKDIDSNVFEVFLRFLYSGKVDKLDGMCLDLFAAADMYDVQSLRIICIHHMSANMSVDNVVNILALAERHSIEATKSSALQFIKMNFADVVKTASWASLLGNHHSDVNRRLAGGSERGKIMLTNNK